MGITGSGFINSAAMKYSAAIGQNPLKRKSINTMVRAQKTEKSKYSATPLQTPSIIPLRERYSPP
jgi:hypothetical protein